MKKILILYPLFPPSNLAGVHRPRLFAQHLKEFGWEPVILTVHERYYEERPDWALVKLLPGDLRIEKVDALKVGNIRLIGDIGLRSFFQLYQRAKQLINEEGFDFLYVPIPSFYCALLGRLLHAATHIKYGIDYIDPWVHTFPGSDKLFSRHWISTKIANFLEPIAIKKASLITGVAAGYYQGVIDRNPALVETALFGAMPYGGEPKDHAIAGMLDTQPYLFNAAKNAFRFVYAGAMLPKAYAPLEAIFKSISGSPGRFENIEFHFIGTGSLANDPASNTIKPLAEKYGLWHSIIFEHPQRIPYLDVLVHLNHADAIFILGSTEAHYTPSKMFQGVLSGKPLLAVLHKESSAVNIIETSAAGMVLSHGGEADVKKIENQFNPMMETFLHFARQYDVAKINMNLFEEYSARSVTARLAELLNAVTQRPGGKIRK